MYFTESNAVTCDFPAEGTSFVHDHTVKAYDRELDTLERLIAEMGGVAEKMVVEAVDALANADTVLARQVVSTDPRLDALQREIENLAVMTIARRQPMAVDLRQVIGAIRVAGDLERVGDLAKNIARRTVKLETEVRVSRALVGVKHMNEVATALMKDVLDAYAQRDAERAREVWERDVDLDALDDAVFRDLLTHMMEDPRNISFCAHLLFCSKNIERIGDHATNIAETVVYLATGEPMPLERPRGGQTIDIDVEASGGVHETDAKRGRPRQCDV
jgi:phosphate transport system protein